MHGLRREDASFDGDTHDRNTQTITLSLSVCCRHVCKSVKADVFAIGPACELLIVVYHTRRLEISSPFSLSFPALYSDTDLCGPPRYPSFALLTLGKIPTNTNTAANITGQSFRLRKCLPV